MKIKYIIDYKGYGNIYQLTNTRTGECLDITREQAQDYKLSSTFFSVKAEVSLNALPQEEVKRPLGYDIPGQVDMAMWRPGKEVKRPLGYSLR